MREREKKAEKEKWQTTSIYWDQGGESTEAKRNEIRRKKEEREEKGIGREEGGVEHLREMDLGAPRGHILFPFEAPDKSNVAECIIR